MSLSSIERDANWALHYANQARLGVRCLMTRPGFETMAEDSLKRVELGLTEAIAVIREARNALEMKEVA